ncbi:DUF58 domain-containing protein [Rhodobium gokarnense]|uniref:Uncharacterized protein (DUF58 family) n=1 Tax=Rhodobium gokarnense TaxID=364296 RepID=A0ABT3HGA3_9HYPH|nr:DUF58 domain-containing protein [Rhodobium gokarnense]MCW2309417.1 uncharacterized protein (DUF58 family) [Rhodobium gokarnense]
MAGTLALVLSVVASVLGGVLREAALLPWALLAFAGAADLLLSPSRRKEVAFELVPEIFVGETADLKLAVANAPDALRGRLEWPVGVSGPGEFAFEVSDDRTARARVPCRAVRRGNWSFEYLWLSWQSRLKLFEFVPRIAVGASVRVVPNIRLVQSGQITTTVASTLFGVKENRIIGEGSEFHQLRDFVQGMDVKTIDWKRSARRRSLVAKELRAERNHQVIVALDTGYLMREEVMGIAKIDHAVTAALATAWAAIIGGDLVACYAYDIQPRVFVAPQAGRAAFARLRSLMADFTYVGRETNHMLALSELNARTPKRSLIVIFTDFVDTTSAELLIENIGILARRHVLIFVTLRDPETEGLVETAPETLNGVATLVAASQSIAERRLVHERLARLGVTVVDARPDQVTARLISAYLDIKAREVI